MNHGNFIQRAARRARLLALGLLAAAALVAPAARADDLPDGWTVRRADKGIIFAPVRMNQGEKLEVWLATDWFKVQREVRPAERLLQIRQQAGLMNDGRCQPPQLTQDGTATQQCQAGDAQLQYMLLPAGSGGYFVRLLRMRVVGNDVPQRYRDGIMQTMKIAMNHNQATALLEQHERQEGARVAQAIRTTPGRGVRDDDIAAIFVDMRVDQGRNETVQREVHTTWLLLKDGTGYQNKIPPDELNVKASRQLEPQRWVQWRKPLFGGNYEIRGPDDSNWRSLPTGKKGWLAQPARPGERLNGTYRHLDGWGNVERLRIQKATWRFGGDGRFELALYGYSGISQSGVGTHFNHVSERESDAKGSRKRGGMSNTDTLGGVATTSSSRGGDDGASRRGRYRLSGWVLEVERDDGQLERHFVTFPGGSRKDMDIDSVVFEGCGGKSC